MTVGKITCWAVGDVHQIRQGAWEVCHSADDGHGGLCVSIFTGPDAKRRALDYATYLESADYDDIEDLLS